MNRTYFGGPDGHSVWRREDSPVTASSLSPTRSQMVANHSPDGFSWGYGGSGPAQLALALLLDAMGDGLTETAVALHQQFKWQYVAGWGPVWEITQGEILDWVEDQGKKMAVSDGN